MTLNHLLEFVSATTTTPLFWLYFPLVVFESNDMDLQSINFIHTTMNIAIWQKNPLFIHKLLNPFPVQIIVNWNMKMSTSSTLVSGMIEVGGGGGDQKSSKALGLPNKTPPKTRTKTLITIPKNPMLFQLFPVKSEDTDPWS